MKQATTQDDLLSLIIIKERFMKWAGNVDEKETELLRKQFAVLTGFPAKSGLVTSLVTFSAGFEAALNFIDELEQKERGSHETSNNTNGRNDKHVGQGRI